MLKVAKSSKRPWHADQHQGSVGADAGPALPTGSAAPPERKRGRWRIPYGPDAIEQLARLGGLVKGKPGSSNNHVQVAALNAILDRAYGKPRQPVEGEMLYGISAELAQLIDNNADAEANFLGFDADGDSVH